MALLCFDIASGGLSAALFDFNLDPIRIVEFKWELATDETGAATLPLDTIVGRFREAIRALAVREPLDGIAIGSFMHNCVLLDAGGKPLTPVFTWLDRQGEPGVEKIRSRMGNDFHRRTGCRYHPMFPVFKLAALHAAGSSVLVHTARAVSIKAYLVHRLTGVWMEDYGMASASGLFNVEENDWDQTVLSISGISRAFLPGVRDASEAAGQVSDEAARDFGLAPGTPVINGSGDGILAHIGSGCSDTATKLSVSLGTSAVARQTSVKPVFDIPAGTFCYRGAGRTFLLGCAGSNGGNVLDWGRSVFGEAGLSDETAGDIPIFIPLLHGERSPEWDASLTGSWHGLKALHTAAELGRSILEGVVFNLAYLTDILSDASQSPASAVVLSGNGFMHPLAAPLFASIGGDRTVWLPAEPGLASLRGAAICILKMLGRTVPELRTVRVEPQPDGGVAARYRKFRVLRTVSGCR